VASDFGGILTQAELNILNADSSNIINFPNSGGGLYAMAEHNSGAGLTPMADGTVLFPSSSPVRSSTRAKPALP
jgi:hypothetical protein